MKASIITGHQGIGSTIITGEVIVANDNFSARYDVDLVTGKFSRPGHKLFGESFANKVIALNIAKGGVASAWMLHSLASGKHKPLALLLNKANPIMVQGAVFAKLPLVDRFDEDITAVLNPGYRVRVNPQMGTVEILND